MHVSFRSGLALVLALGLASGAAGQEPELHADPLVEPPASRFEQFLDEMMGVVNPWVSDLVEMLGDLSGWNPPEFLPNGDIIIRRRRTEEPEVQGTEGSDTGEPFEL